MNFHHTQCVVGPGEAVHLSKRPTQIDALYTSHDDYQRQLASQVATLAGLQDRLYASNSYALLIIFQAMDAAGKDGVIKHVMSGLNPQGCEVHSYKHPSSVELQHDFLWRTTRDLPERGRIGIFNRSYYEEVLIARVHPEILRDEGVPNCHGDHPQTWQHRFDSINGLERHLDRNGTRIVKIFLHVSKAEQKRRFIDRIDRPEKNWKICEADIAERAHWDRYMQCYEDCLTHTSTEHAPWHVVPADDKPNARLIVAHVVADALRQLKLDYPAVDAARRKALQSLRTRLEAES